PRMTLLTFAVVLLLGTDAEAQKVKMPKEGTFEWEFSLAAPADMPVATKELTLMHYVSRGNIKAIPEGGPFDRQSGTCWGTMVMNNYEYRYPTSPWPATGNILHNRVWSKGTYKLAQ